MKKRILKSILVILLILELTLINILFLGYHIVIALTNELETQENNTNIANVKFDAYFKENNEIKHCRQVNISDEEIFLYININILEKGNLDNAKIKINDSNFKIKNSDNLSEYIKNINIDRNEIELKTIMNSNKVEIKIPIEFNKIDVINEDYFIKNTNIILTGNYKEGETNEYLKGEISTRLEWSDNEEINMYQSIDKYIDLNENEILIQQEIISEVQKNKLPRNYEVINIDVPKLSENNPSEIYVLLNGEKISQDKVTFNEKDNLLEVKITYENEKDKCENKENIYKIVYIYPRKISEDIKEIEFKTRLRTKLFTKNEVQKEDLQTFEINNIGNVVDIKSEILTNEIYKGYLYAKAQNEIEFEEAENINISYSKNLEEIIIETLDNQFIDKEENEFYVGNSINYKGLSINKQNMINILGPNGEIMIKDQKDNVLTIIDSYTLTDENGNINITYDENKKNIKLIISEPIIEGTLTVKHIKSLNGDCEYTKEQLKLFTNIVSKNKLINNGFEEFSETKVMLQDTKTKLEFEISNDKLSTIQKNEDVTFLITLKSNNEQYDLYKNPNIEIIIPREIDLEVKSINQLNANEELQIVNPRLINNDDGTKVIKIPLKGEQIKFQNDINEGVQISITTNISIDKKTPSKVSSIIVNYTNENRKGEIFKEEIPININSKSGVLLLNRLSNFNSSDEILESIDDKTKKIMIESGVKQKVASEEISIINNYQNDITDIALIGRLPNDEEKVINGETIKASFGLNLSNEIHNTEENIEIYYSEDLNADKTSNSWKKDVDDFSNIRAFKIELKNNKLEAGNIFSINMQLNIPENLKNNESTYISLMLTYNYLESELSNYSNIALITEQTNDEMNQISEENIGNLTIKMLARTSGEKLEEGEEIFEGQGIKYILSLTNNSDKNMKNVRITATQTNAVFYDEIIYNDGWDSVTGEEGVKYTRIEENPDLKEKLINIESISAGETIEVEYQFSVQKIEEDTNITSGKIKIEAEGLETKEIETLNNYIKAGKIKLQIRNKLEEEYDILTNRELPFFLDVTNISDSIQENIKLELPVPEGFEFETNSLFEADDYQFIEYTDRKVILEIPELDINQKISIRLGFEINPMDNNIKYKKYSFIYKGILDNETYFSNEMDRIIYNSESNIVAKQYGSIEGDTVKNGDNLIYTCEIINYGGKDKEIAITDYVPMGAIIKNATVKVYDISNNGNTLIGEEKIETIYIDEDGNRKNINSISYAYNLCENQKLVLIVDTIIDVNQIFESNITNEIIINALLQEIPCNSVTYKVAEKEDINEDDTDQEDKTTYNISGIAWLDKNKNGLRELTEERLDNISVLLIEEKTGLLAKNIHGISMSSLTNDMGEYQFNDIEQGDYIIVFIYDIEKYRITEYQKQGVDYGSNSDVISKTISLNGKEQKVAMTGTIKIIDANIENIDAGFVELDKFDFRLDKYINRIIIQNAKETTVINYNEAKLAKIELDAKKISNTTIVIEYQIKVTNEGEVSGYVNEVVDIIPEGLNFASEMNKNWYKATDGKVYTNELSNQLINVGETKIINIILTKTINQDNMGTVINIAELNDVSNNYSLKDIDSIPGNGLESEDDMSIAELIISIKTGISIQYKILMIVIISIIGIGIYYINKKVLILEK